MKLLIRKEQNVEKKESKRVPDSSKSPRHKSSETDPKKNAEESASAKAEEPKKHGERTFREKVPVIITSNEKKWTQPNEIVLDASPAMPTNEDTRYGELEASSSTAPHVSPKRSSKEDKHLEEEAKKGKR